MVNYTKSKMFAVELFKQLIVIGGGRLVLWWEGGLKNSRVRGHAFRDKIEICSL